MSTGGLRNKQCGRRLLAPSVLEVRRTSNTVLNSCFALQPVPRQSRDWMRPKSRPPTRRCGDTLHHTTSTLLPYLFNFSRWSILGRGIALANCDPLSSHATAAWQETEVHLPGTSASFAYRIVSVTRPLGTTLGGKECAPADSLRHHPSQPSRGSKLPCDRRVTVLFCHNPRFSDGSSCAGRWMGD
jgi:hypothetical protein